MTAIIGIPCAVVVGLVLFVGACNQGHPGHFKFGSWEFMKIWRVHVNTDQIHTELHFGTNRRAAIRRVHIEKQNLRWNRACYLSWRWEISHHGVRARNGRLHRRGMYSHFKKEK